MSRHSPLAGALRQLGVAVWYDEFTLRPGDSLSRSIDKGILGSLCGLVVISPKFIEKNWPEYEYNEGMPGAKGLLVMEEGDRSECERIVRSRRTAVSIALNRTPRAGGDVKDDLLFVECKQRAKEELQAVGKFLVKPGLSKVTLGISSFLLFGFERWQVWRGRDPKTKARQDGIEEQKRQQAVHERKLDEVLEKGSATIDR